MARGSSLAARLAPIFLYAAGAIYLVFAAYLALRVIHAYQPIDIIDLIAPYFEYAPYLMPVALLLGFLGWYFGGGAHNIANLFATISAAALLASFFVYWAIIGATLDVLFGLWAYWIPPAVNLILGAYALTSKAGLTPPPSALEPLFENERRRALRPISNAPAGAFQTIERADFEARRRRALREV